MKIIIKEFLKRVDTEWSPEEAQIEWLQKLISYSELNGYKISKEYDYAFIEAVNQKLDLNSKVFKIIMDCAFREHVKFNYIQKTQVKAYLDSDDKESYLSLLTDMDIHNETLISKFLPVHKAETMKELKNIIETDKKYLDVLSSIFSRYCFNLFERKCTAEFFSNEKDIDTNYYEFISKKYEDICKRDFALSVVKVKEDLFTESYEKGCNIVLATIKKSYESLNNHCEMIVYIPALNNSKFDYQWQLYSDIILFSEKHVKEKIDRAYFRWEKIGNVTKNYIDSLVPFNAEFDYANQGFVFKDCFVIGHEKKYDLMLIFEKNVRDERIINCPACCSNNIQGNSYPILNVRSWECKNPLCPDRSKYNRGKRYAFTSLFRQYQLQDEDNIIPESSIARWHLDCLEDGDYKEALAMAINHYSCAGDTVIIYDDLNEDKENEKKRKLVHKKYEIADRDLLGDFRQSSYFYRYLQINHREINETNSIYIGKARIIHGDSFDALRKMDELSVDAAVTSPPYYNAKSYSQWENIYCYLYDMYNISKEIFRVMKEGGVYLFNIFDYFDNENNISLSAMGDKRMVLGAYMIDIFRRVGFNVDGNIIWNKGEIQGNRNFNQGNRTPYYQAPLNCWEHVLILSKGTKNREFNEIKSSIQDIRPVIKMVRGKNVLGHDAPYPKEIPELLIRYMKTNEVVLDPFLGSGTTSIVANEYGVESVGIEKSDEYFILCEKQINKSLEERGSGFAD